METAIEGGQLAVAVLGMLVLAWECWPTLRGRAGATRAVGNRTFAALAVLGVAAFTSFGTLHEGRFIHIWDTYHYYVGAKYSPELGYDLLYECTAVADAGSGLPHDVAARTMTDLRTNQQVATLEILRHPETCLRHFTPARWDSFTHDVAWFRDRVDWRTWHQIQRDHGYNATPVWNAVGHLLANLAPASDVQITCLALLDPALLVAALLLLGRCFGWRVCAIAAVMLGTFYPARFYWTGGAFLRFDWLFCIVAGLCALKRRRPLLGGALLAYAALLRLFPAVVFLGPALAALDQVRHVRHVRRTRTWSTAHLRMFAGAALTVAIAVPPALAISGDGGRSFVENTIKHAETPLTNHMGLPTVLAYRPDTTVRQLRERATANLWPRFKQARQDALHAARPVIVAAGLVVLVLLVPAARREPWRAAALSLVMVPVVLQLTCYYYVFVIALAVLAEHRPRAGIALLGMCAASMAVALGLAARVGMDELYVALSVVTLVGLGAAWALARRGRGYRRCQNPRATMKSIS